MQATQTLGEVLALGHAKWAVPQPLAQCRLRRYSPYQDELLEPFTPAEHGLTLQQLGLRSYGNVYLETRAAAAEFPVYDRFALTFRVFEVVPDAHAAPADPPACVVATPARRVTVGGNATLGDLKTALAAILGVASGDDVRVAYIPYSKRPALLLGDSKSLRLDHRLYASLPLFAEVVTPALRAHEAAVCAESRAKRRAARAANAAAVRAAHRQDSSGSTTSEEVATDGAHENAPALDVDATAAPAADEDSDADDVAFDAEVAYAHSPSAAAIDAHEHSVELILALPDDDAAAPPRVWKVDERIALSAFKEKVAAFLDRPAGEFRLFSLASRYAVEPTELTRLTLSLRNNYLDTGTRITVRYGQALGVGETRVAVDLFTPWRGAGDVDTAALFKPLLPAATAREGETVAEWRAKLLADPAVAAVVTVPPAQVRLREKSYTGCGAILLDSHVVGKDVVLYVGKVFLLELLDGASRLFGC